MAGTFVISLDFELMWGVRDRRTVGDYGDAIIGVRRAIPEMLALFEAAGIRATWATVGLLFARNRDEMFDYAPKLLPTYRCARLSPYGDIRGSIGADEASDPYHYGASLIRRIMASEGQEIATHTFSHYYCLEDGQTLEQFTADIDAAIAIARNWGVTLESIVFPRNQSMAACVAVCRDRGIVNWRGNPTSFLYRARARQEEHLPMRLMRLADSILPVSPSRLSHAFPTADAEAINVPASRFLRPYSTAAMSNLQARRIMDEMTAAARMNEIYHLWWHPHNFGRATDQNMATLRRILAHFEGLRERFGMRSANMRDVGRDVVQADTR